MLRTVALAVTLTGLALRSMPAPAAVACTMPAIDFELGVDAVSPLTKVVVSPAPLPRVTVPVFKNVVAVSTVFVVPVRATL